VTLNKVRGGDLLAGIGGLALLGVMFAPWFRFLEGVYVGSRVIAPNDTLQNAWESVSVLRFALVITALLGIAQLVATAFERTTAWPVAAEVFGAAIGSVTTLWTLLRLIDPPGPNFGAERRWGAYVGLACCTAVAVGAWWSMRDEVRPDPVVSSSP
jgi:hypothetical protein